MRVGSINASARSRRRGRGPAGFQRVRGSCAPANSRWNADRWRRCRPARRLRAPCSNRPALDFSTAPTVKPARSYSPGGYMSGISAVSPPISAQPAISQPWRCRRPRSPWSRRRVCRWRSSRGRTAARRPAPASSFTHIATRSWPMPSCRFSCLARISLVPTPSVPETSTGSPVAARTGRTGRRTGPRRPALPGAWSPDQRFDPFDDSVARVDVDAGIAVGQAGGGRGSGARGPERLGARF